MYNYFFNSSILSDNKCKKANWKESDKTIHKNADITLAYISLDNILK
jgi:hypothetical protein